MQQKVYSMSSCSKTIIACGCVFISLTAGVRADNGFFLSRENGEMFAKDVTALVEKSWKPWQDKVLVDDIAIDGSRGVLSPGDLRGPEIKSKKILERFDRGGKSQYYISAVRAVTDAFENGMRLWQRGYSHKDIPFPLGASCSFTLPPCNNIPVSVASGSSTGDSAMAEEELFNYLLYRVPTYDEGSVLMMRAAAKGIAETFKEWKRTCSIVGISGSGGIAPHPAPMGTGPGPVRGAKGENGKLIGPYFDGAYMYKVMMAEIELNNR